MQSDAQLLAEWTARRSDAAFARLVERYVALVHSAARRQVSDPHLAQEVTQAVFILLARKAGSLGRQTVLAGWLCRTAHFAARDALRAERRRQHREQLAATMDTSPDAAWQQLAPVLDEAVAQLRETDRNAIVLRYYEQRSLDETGAALGVGADAAQKRVARALEKLRAIFAKRGVTLTGAAIAGAVSANAVQVVPAGLTAKISAAAIIAGTTLATTTAIVMTTLQKTIIGATLTAAVGFGIYEARQVASLRAEAEALKQQQAPLAEQIRQLTRERDDAVRQSGPVRDAANEQRLRKEHLELLSLRGRVTQLANELRKRQNTTNAKPAAEPTGQEPDSILFSASLTNRVASGKTLVVGGWSGRGMQSYLLLTPVIRQGDDTLDAERVAVQGQVVGAPESFWNQIGWAEAKSDMHRSTLAGVLTPEQLDMLLGALEETKDGMLSNTSTAKGQDGKRMAFGWSASEDNGDEGMLMDMEVYPRIASDGQSLDLEIRPSVLSTNTPIHPALRPSAQPSSASPP